MPTSDNRLVTRDDEANGARPDDLRLLATRIETSPWSPSSELAVSLVRSAALSLEGAAGPAEAGSVRKGLLTFEHLFRLRGARLVESNLLVAQRLRTEWELGQMLRAARLRGGDQGAKSRRVTLLRLNDYGVSKNQSMAFQRIAQVERDDLEHWIAENANDRELSTAAALEDLWREAARARAAERAAASTAEREASAVPLPCLLAVADAAHLPLPDGSVDLTVTSPPYGLDVGYDIGPDDPDDWLALLRCWLTELRRVTRDGGRLALNIPLDTTRGGTRPTYAQAVAAAELAGWTYRFSIVWLEDTINKSVARGSMDSAAAPHVITPVEMVPVFYRGSTWRREPPDGGSDLDHLEWLEWTNGLWRFGGESQPFEGHPAAFPAELPRRLVKLLSFPGDTVLDPFCGSGTTPLEAHRLNRKAVGFDISAAYIASAGRRLATAIGGNHADR